MSDNDKVLELFCGTLAVERPRYFARQLITPEDMIAEQDYFRNRLRLHNRLLHGWGVVCGVLVSPVVKQNGAAEIEPWKIRVCPGYILGPYGDEIVIPCAHIIDLRQKSVTGTAEPEPVTSDPWCSEVWVAGQPDSTYYIAVKYKEIAARPVRVQPWGCGCDESRCEYSRWRDGYEIGVLTATEYESIKAAEEPAPPEWSDLFKPSDPADARTGHPSCWPCPTQPWVVLAKVTVDNEGRPDVIDNCSLRRMVAALGGFYWQCKTEVKISSVSPAVVYQDTSDVQLHFTGANFQEGLTLILGNGVSVKMESFTPVVNKWPNEFTVKVDVSSDALAVKRDVLVVNPDCSWARGVNSLEVKQTPAPVEISGEKASVPPTSKRPSRKRER